MYGFIIFMEISENFCLPDLPLHKAVWLTSRACCHFSTSSSGERPSCICARTSPNSQAMSKLFPLSVLGMSDTLYPPQKKISIKNKLTMATERKVGLSDWACVSNLSGRKRGNTQRSLPSLPLLSTMSFHSLEHWGPCVSSYTFSTNNQPPRCVSRQLRFCRYLQQLSLCHLPSLWLQQSGWTGANRWCCASLSSSCLRRLLNRCRSKVRRHPLQRKPRLPDTSRSFFHWPSAHRPARFLSPTRGWACRPVLPLCGKQPLLPW